VQPLIEVPVKRPPTLSFTNLVEAFVLASIRREHLVSLQRVRKAIAYVRQELEVERPLMNELFKTDGVDLFVERYGQLINASKEGQVAIRVAFESRLERIEWDRSGVAARLFPFVRSGEHEQPKALVIDPRRGFGRPVLAGTGIAAIAVAERSDAGESISSLADDYGVRVELIEDAIRCERRAAA
jgi:uncharacterized protein (DUF433 family)